LTGRRREKMPKNEELTKRQLNYIRELKREMAIKMAKKTREYKKNEFEKAVAKDKVETCGDIYGLLCGLSWRAKEIAAMNRIEMLAGMGYSPAKIIELMDIKKGKRNEKIDLESQGTHGGNKHLLPL
jgi:hypothetical protein